MNLFTALKKPSPFHFTSLFIYLFFAPYRIEEGIWFYVAGRYPQDIHWPDFRGRLTVLLPLSGLLLPCISAVSYLLVIHQTPKSYVDQFYARPCLLLSLTECLTLLGGNSEHY